MNQDDLANISAQTKHSEKGFDHVVKVCVAAGCLSANAEQVKTQLEGEVKHRGLETCCKIKGVGCMGLCAAGPLVSADANQKMFQAVTPADAASIIDNVMENKPVAEAIVLDNKLDFFTRQKKIVLENSGEIDPERIEDYIAADGYEALFHAITKLKPLRSSSRSTKSGLRGRGGAGFPRG